MHEKSSHVVYVGEMLGSLTGPALWGAGPNWLNAGPGHDRWLLTTSRAPFGVGFVPRYSPQLLTTRGWGFICQLVISASNKSGSHNAVDEKLPNVYYFLHAIHVHRTCIRPRYCVPLTLIILCEIWLKLLWFVSFHSTTIYIVGKHDNSWVSFLLLVIL